jgi:hypothetical protein
MQARRVNLRYCRSYATGARAAQLGRGMAEVFISYSQKDRALIAPISARLAELGVNVWFDREISAGEDYQKAIFAQLKKAGAVLVCWSPTATESQYVNSEATYSLGMKKYVPFKIASCELEPPFNIIHTDDLSEWKGAANDPNWIRLVERIAQLIGREAVAAVGAGAGNGGRAGPL